MAIVRRKKQSRNESIKAFKEKLDDLLEEHKLDIETFPKLEDLQKHFQVMMKTMETVKKTRNNANTGLGKPYELTPEAIDFIYHNEDLTEARDFITSNSEKEEALKTLKMASRSFITKLISAYVKKKQLQSTPPLYFECDALLCNLFSSAYLTPKRLVKYMHLRCMKERFPNHEDTYINIDESHSFDKFQLQENDLISWRELQKILCLAFKNGSD